MRKRAAVVPASKAKIGETYAVERDGKLFRFVVDRVTTHRIAEDGSPHDYKSEITGRFIIGNPLEMTSVHDSKVYEKATIEPNRLLGQYEAYAELAEKAKVEKEAKEAKHKAEHEAALDLWRLLYQVSGLQPPNDTSGYGLPFRYSQYGGANININTSGIKPLLDALRKLAREKETA